MSDQVHIFASLGSKEPRTARKVHIRRLYDLLQLFLQQNDMVRARRAWSILARCKEIDWKSMWLLGVHLLNEKGTRVDESVYAEVEFLREIMVQKQDERETILKEIVVRLILLGRHQDALDELELYLPSFPYQDNPVLHILAGMVALYLAQTPSPTTTGTNEGSSRNPSLLYARRSFERAKALDPHNMHASTYLDQMPTFTRSQSKPDSNYDSEEMSTDERPRHKKRTKA